ncbi:hypothetical protein QVZ41_13780 [Wenyingzhuangia sp. chi5]|uniref:DUF3575 domain-containing protein n=1 Tax=Wenyingzhuangia gilva TaxID=3057677 RepID=A0ABT8VVB5_9FLAO|nr:hypothetical protein [Wenyingzhuangia sp. chi5]MDO3695916.1 hypothetical protein [Wenyingzhuangia sp. chi5]
MKKTFLTLIFLGLTFILKAQNSSAENSTSGIQIGTPGIWIHNENKLINSLILRTELGFDIATWGNISTWGGKDNGIIMNFVVTAEPRWYYNLDKRKAKSKRIDGNSGNFLSLKTSFYPNKLVISNIDNTYLKSYIMIFPTWGIKRNIGKYFNYEAGFGVGYRHYYAKEHELASYQSNNKIVSNVHLRIGYRF